MMSLLSISECVNAYANVLPSITTVYIHMRQMGREILSTVFNVNKVGSILQLSVLYSLEDSMLFSIFSVTTSDGLVATILCVWASF
jgi:hypothetical protein